MAHFTGKIAKIRRNTATAGLGLDITHHESANELSFQQVTVTEVVGESA